MISKKHTVSIFVLVAVLIAAGAVLRFCNKEESLRSATTRPMVAIVIDDFGYSLASMTRIYNIKKPLTLSVLPDAPYSEKIAVEAPKRGCELILHLPLEPYDQDEPLEPGTIYATMSRDSIRERLGDAFKRISAAKGVSNHMGSKATEDRALMTVIFKELAKRHLFFLDSVVTDGSICEGLASELGLKFARRDVYLDNIAEADYIKGQLGELVQKAKETGASIGIGHDRPLTVMVLAEQMPKIEEEEKVEFVFVSALVR